MKVTKQQLKQIIKEELENQILEEDLNQELQKLVKLRDQGIIDEKEFQQYKKKLLAQGQPQQPDPLSIGPTVTQGVGDPKAPAPAAADPSDPLSGGPTITQAVDYAEQLKIVADTLQVMLAKIKEIV